ncbi:MAG: di-heme oxidoredictase family protein, partial [Parvibaculaceae bacterium]
CTEQQQRCLNQANGRSPDFDNEELSGAIVNAVAAYVAALNRKAPEGNPEGEKLFAATGCAQCHVPVMPSSTGKALSVFSDLLLHDLGEGLAGAYGDREFSAQEWRTAPLIDMSDRQGKRRYLHDGRAASIADAVRWHDGEAHAARDRFLALEERDRKLLLDYVGSL